MLDFNRIKTTDSGDYDKEEVDEYLNGLMSDFARMRSAMQRNVDNAKADRQAAMDEMNSLRDRLDESEAERSQLESMISDMRDAVSEAEAGSGDASQNREETTRSVFAQEEPSADEFPRNGFAQMEFPRSEPSQSSFRRDKATPETASDGADAQSAFAGSGSEQTQSSQESAGQGARSGFGGHDFSWGKYAGGAFTEDIPAGADAAADETAQDKQDDGGPETEVMEPYYNTSLMTGSGYELLDMLRGLAGGVQGNKDSSVMISKSWEEEESVADPNDKEGKFVKTIRRKTEISVKYVPGSGKTE